MKKLYRIAKPEVHFHAHDVDVRSHSATDRDGFRPLRYRSEEALPSIASRIIKYACLSGA